MQKFINLGKNFQPFGKEGQSNCIKYQFSTFPGGEEHVRIDTSTVENVDKVMICASIQSSADVMRLFMLTDALRGMWIKDIELFMPYLPYARQDRVCNPGEAFSVKAFSKLINTQNYSKVYVVDPHSEIGVSHINNVVIIDNHEFVKSAVEQLGLKDYVLCSPDAGSLKKIYKLGSHLGCTQLAKADKLRDMATTKIIMTEVHETTHGQLKDKDVLIVDDICDGGRTFIELAKVLREKGAKRVFLIVTHGIFSAGFEVFDGLIDKVVSTTSFGEKSDSRLLQINFEIIDIL